MSVPPVVDELCAWALARLAPLQDLKRHARGQRLRLAERVLSALLGMQVGLHKAWVPVEGVSDAICVTLCMPSGMMVLG